MHREIKYNTSDYITRFIEPLGECDNASDAKK